VRERGEEKGKGVPVGENEVIKRFQNLPDHDRDRGERSYFDAVGDFFRGKGPERGGGGGEGGEKGLAVKRGRTVLEKKSEKSSLNPRSAESKKRLHRNMETENLRGYVR